MTSDRSDTTTTTTTTTTFVLVSSPLARTKCAMFRHGTMRFAAQALQARHGVLHTLHRAAMNKHHMALLDQELRSVAANASSAAERSGFESGK